MKRIAKFTVAVTGLFLLTVGISANSRAETVLVNGSFETGDYTGWHLYEGEEGSKASDGTWGIAYDGQTIYQAKTEVHDYFDNDDFTQNSSGLPRTYFPSDGTYMAIQLQNEGQDHELWQDVTLPENATTLSWDMFYNNLAGYFASDQNLVVSIYDLSNGNVQEILLPTLDSDPLRIPMTNFAFDISPYAGSTVRIDVMLRNHWGFFDAGFDNFRIGLAEEPADEPAGEDAPPAVSAPPGWSRSSGKKLGWSEHKKDKEPRGFSMGQKKGWNE